MGLTLGARPLEATVNPGDLSPPTVKKRPRELAPVKPHRAAVSAFSKGDPNPLMPDAPEGRGRPHLTFTAPAMVRDSGNTRAVAPDPPQAR